MIALQTTHISDDDAYVLAGCGAWLRALATALQEAGFAPLRVLDVAAAPDWREELGLGAYERIVYASGEEGIEPLRVFDRMCREEGKALLPLLVFPAAAIVGPYAQQGTETGFEAAWRSIRREAVQPCRSAHEPSPLSPYVAAILANMVLKSLKPGGEEGWKPPLHEHVYLLDLEKLEGGLVAIHPHPLVSGRLAFTAVRDTMEAIVREDEPGGAQPDGLFACFERWTSKAAGVFHAWGEDELVQLPLALCRVQPADPLSEGPTGVLPAMIRSGITHTEARLSAGLAGIEAYAETIWQSAEPLRVLGGRTGSAGIGAGRTLAEAVHRGLQACLGKRLRERLLCEPEPAVSKLQLSEAKDEQCSHMWRLLQLMCGEPAAGSGADIAGCPVAWVNAGGVWFGAADIDFTLALRRAVRQALEHAQRRDGAAAVELLTAASVKLMEAPSLERTIPPVPEAVIPEAVRSAIAAMKLQGIAFEVMELYIEPFARERTVRIAAAMLREEDGGR